MATDKRKMKVLITGESENPTRINLRAGKFTMIIDEPTSMGGTDAGPSPVQVLLLSLAGCLNMTGHEIARQKGFKLNGMKIRIEGVMNPCTFLGCSFEERAGFQEIDVKIDADFEGVSPEAQAQWLKETEERCPVTDNIKADTTVRVTLA
jgi:uncharacterized OsmC-like protein